MIICAMLKKFSLAAEPPNITIRGQNCFNMGLVKFIRTWKRAEATNLIHTSSGSLLTGLGEISPVQQLHGQGKALLSHRKEKTKRM